MRPLRRWPVDQIEPEVTAKEGRAGVAWVLARRRLASVKADLVPRADRDGRWPAEHTPAPGALVYQWMRLDGAVARAANTVAALRDLQAVIRSRRFEQARGLGASSSASSSTPF